MPVRFNTAFLVGFFQFGIWSLSQYVSIFASYVKPVDQSSTA